MARATIQPGSASWAPARAAIFTINSKSLATSARMSRTSAVSARPTTHLKGVAVHHERSVGVVADPQLGGYGVIRGRYGRDRSTRLTSETRLTGTDMPFQRLSPPAASP
jgi:hypothetical protein